MRTPLCFCVYKNTKIQRRESALPFFSLPLLLHLVIHAPMPQNVIWNVPFCLLGYPILPFGVSHFTIWDVPFCHLGYPISPFGVSHFAIWGIPFCLWGCPISPFGVSHFTIWSIFLAHLRTIYSPDFRFAFFDFRCKIYAFSFVNWKKLI